MTRAVITGGSGGLGSVIAAALRVRGDEVHTPSSSELDVRDPTAVSEWFRDRPVDLLVCAAGVTRDAPLARLTESAWDEVLRVSYQGALACASVVAPGMIERGAGHIVFVSSYSAFHPPVGQSAYAAAKASLLGLTSDLAIRWGSSNLRVNTILPGFLETRMTASLGPNRRNQIAAEHALGRFNECSSAAAFIAFLHHELPHTSGQIFHLDSRPHPFC